MCDFCYNFMGKKTESPKLRQKYFDEIIFRVLPKFYKKKQSLIVQIKLVATPGVIKDSTQKGDSSVKYKDKVLTID